MRIKTLSKTFRLPSDLIVPDKRVFAVGETENTLLVKNAHGLAFHLRKSVISTNGMASHLGCIVLPDALYKHHVEPVIKKANEQASLLLEKHFGLVMQNYHLVLQNPEYFLIRTPWLSSGGTVSGPVHYCLGGLVESWMKSKKLRTKDREGKPVYVVRVGGSNLSGALWAKGWVPSENKWACLGNDELNGNLQAWLLQYSKLQSAYPQTLTADFAAIGKLIKHCKIRAQ
jgi:hypothetical protein